MKKMTSSFQGGMAFQPKVGNHQIIIETWKQNGGNDLAPFTKQLLLVSLAGCTCLNVVSTLNKIRVAYNKFENNVEAIQIYAFPEIYN